PDHLWRLDLTVAAQSIGSGLQPALTLFNAQGDVLATRNSGTGSQADPTDPYLSAGLNPGTYYVGVSGAGNLPDLTGGYDPVEGTPGTVGRLQPGGPFPFQLHLVAEPVDTSTSLVDSSLGYGDP